MEPGASPSDVVTPIQSAIPATKTIVPGGLLSTVSENFAMVTRLFYSSNLATLIVSPPLQGFVSAMVAHEHRMEVALLRALGATKSCIVRLMRTESFSFSVIGGVIGTGIFSIILVFFQDFITNILKIPFNAPTLFPVAGVGAGVILLCIGIEELHRYIPAVLSADQTLVNQYGVESDD